MCLTYRVIPLVTASCLLAACGSGNHAVGRVSTLVATTPSPPEATVVPPPLRADVRFAGRVFGRTGVARCLARARTSHGAVTAGKDGYAGAWNLKPRHGMLDVFLTVTDYSLQEVELGFTGNERDARRFVSRVRAVSRARASPFGTNLVMRRRGNVVFFYRRGIDAEVRRIVLGCLGGPRYRGDGGTPPSIGIPIP